MGPGLRPASSGSASVVTYWWASGSSGTRIPIMSPMAGPQNPAQETTMSASMTVSSPIRTPVTFPPSCSIPVTVVSPRNRTPAAVDFSMSSCTARAADANPSEGTRKPPSTVS